MGSLPAKQLESFQQRVAYHLSLARRGRHRYLIVLSGAKRWALSMIESIESELAGSEVVFVTDQDSAFSFVSSSVKGTKVKHRLGQECDHLIWDGFSGLNPDGLGAASGLVKGGGLYFLLIPELDEFAAKPDKDYLRMCGSEDALAICNTHFLQMFANTIKCDSDVCLIEEHVDYPAIPQLNASLDSVADHTLPTQDQLEVIRRIKKVALGRAKRPLVISADRGRGKSAALGIAAAELVKEKNLHIKITGPSEAACATALAHYRYENSDVSHKDKLVFCPPDDLILNKHEADLLFVDEAASIPAPLLATLLSRYPRVIFSTTVHGYEGTGRGFAVRFMKHLNETTPQWKGVEMLEPIRWSSKDPLEKFIFNVLCLEAEPTDLDKDFRVGTADFNWISGKDLTSNPHLLKEVFGLLVNAHYQTSPSDLRMLLDHPDIILGALTSKGKTLAVVVLIKEGKVDDADLAKGIIRGERKPRNHLVPQALTFATARPSYMLLNSLRVMRIATHPSVQRQGLGSTLLEKVEAYAVENEIDFLSSSFGFTPDLMDFWSSSQYELVRLGRHKDSASGTESVIVAKPLSETARQELETAKMKLRGYFETTISSHHRDMDAAHAWEIMRRVSIENHDTFNDLVIDSVASGHRSLEESIVDITILMRAYCRQNDLLPGLCKQALTIKILQGRSWKTLVSTLNLSGKAEAEKLIREGVAHMYKAICQK